MIPENTQLINYNAIPSQRYSEKVILGLGVLGGVVGCTIVQYISIKNRESQDDSKWMVVGGALALVGISVFGLMNMFAQTSAQPLTEIKVQEKPQSSDNLELILGSQKVDAILQLITERGGKEMSINSLTMIEKLTVIENFLLILDAERDELQRQAEDANVEAEALSFSLEHYKEQMDLIGNLIGNQGANVSSDNLEQVRKYVKRLVDSQNESGSSSGSMGFNSAPGSVVKSPYATPSNRPRTIKKSLIPRRLDYNL